MMNFARLAGNAFAVLLIGCVTAILLAFTVFIVGALIGGC